MGLVSLAVGAGRGADLPAIVRALVERSAASRNKAVAEVRSAVPLSTDQTTRLAAAIKSATGKDVEIKVVIDPSVLGGLVTQIGDTVIDGSVRHRLNQVREAIA
jgi:F-type H+-transporting ATPase subunit delta